MSSFIRQVWDFAPSGPIQWKTPDRSKPAVPLPSFWDSFQKPSLSNQAAYHPSRDTSAAIKKAYDAEIASHNKVAKENYAALRQGYVGNWVTRNRQGGYQRLIK